MKRLMASFRLASASVLATMTRMVWPRTSAESVARATTRVLPSSISFRPNGGDAQPTSTWSVMTAVSVDDGLPVAIGFTFNLYSSIKARTMLLVDEPLVEYAMVFLSVRSVSFFTGEDVLAYQ